MVDGLLLAEGTYQGQIVSVVKEMLKTTILAGPRSRAYGIAIQNV
jgi:hypothetical protein